MSRDPYHDFAADLRNSLSSARALSQTYLDLLSSSSSSASRRSSDLQSAYDRLSDALEALRQDVEDVKQSVHVVERSGPERFGVTPDELQRRKQFTHQCERQIAELERIASRRVPEHSTTDHQHLSIDMAQQPLHHDATEAFEREQQHLLMSRQDSTLDSIGATLLNLRSQAGTMGQEIGEQVELIGALDNDVDRTQSRLSKAMRSMDEVVRISDERLGGWCVWILILVLFILLFMVILI
ncbi:hypothetical protein ACQY0O_006564 [Thecaphora frezii]